LYIDLSSFPIPPFLILHVSLVFFMSANILIFSPFSFFYSTVNNFHIIFLSLCRLLYVRPVAMLVMNIFCYLAMTASVRHTSMLFCPLLYLFF
jgi:hypothetical protein